jgi:hypothetical protein
MYKFPVKLFRERVESKDPGEEVSQESIKKSVVKEVCFTRDLSRESSFLSQKDSLFNSNSNVCFTILCERVTSTLDFTDSHVTFVTLVLKSRNILSPLASKE